MFNPIFFITVNDGGELHIIDGGRIENAKTIWLVIDADLCPQLTVITFASEKKCFSGANVWNEYEAWIEELG